MFLSNRPDIITSPFGGIFPFSDEHNDSNSLVRLLIDLITAFFTDFDFIFWAVDPSDERCLEASHKSVDPLTM